MTAAVALVAFTAAAYLAATDRLSLPSMVTGAAFGAVIMGVWW